MSERTIYLVDLVAATDAAGTEATLRYGTIGYATEPTDTPPDAVYLPRLKRSAAIIREIVSGTRTSGVSRTGFGELVLANIDGGLDALAGYSFEHRAVTVRAGAYGSSYDDLAIVLRGTVSQARFTNAEITLGLRDRQFELTLPLLSTKYGGTNSLPSGLDGVPGDIAGRYKPRVYGAVFNVSPPCVNTARLIYQLNDGDISSATVYIGGVALTAGADYASQSAMETTQPAVGQVRFWPAGGYFRLGSTPTKAVTADIVQGASAADRTAAQIIQTMAIDAGIESADISASDVTALDAANSASVGIWIDDAMPAASAIDAIAQSVGAWWGFDQSGALRMTRFEAPGGTAEATIRAWNCASLERITSHDAIPTWRVSLRHSRYYTVQSSGIDSATAARQSAVGNAWRAAVAEDTGIKTQWLGAQTMERETLLADATAADTEANRLMALYGVQRHCFVARGVKLAASELRSIDLGDVVNVEWPRFGLDAGVQMRVIAIHADYVKNAADITLWY